MRKAQSNIDFIMSMGIFVAIFLMYVHNIVDTISVQMSTLGTLGFETSCLAIANTLTSHLTAVGYSLNETYYRDRIQGCGSPIPGTLSERKYKELKNDLNMDGREINVVITQFLIASTPKEMRSGHHTGMLEYNGSIYDIAVFKSEASEKFDRVNLSGADMPNPLFDLREGNIVALKDGDFRIKRIDPSGNFVLFQRKLADCGIKPALEEKYSRYSFFEKYYGHIVRVDVVCK